MYRVFLPSDGLIKTAQATIQALAIIASLTAIFAALAGALFILTWVCSLLVGFIHALTAVCQATFSAVMINPEAVFATFVTYAAAVLCIKLTLILFPCLSFAKGGAL